MIPSASIELVPQTTVELNEKQSEQLMNLIEKMEDNDDVQNVYHNLEVL